MQTRMLGNVWVTAPANKGYAFHSARESANALVIAAQLTGDVFQGAIDFYMTATPGHTWTLSCGGQGVSPSEAENSFLF